MKISSVVVRIVAPFSGGYLMFFNGEEEVFPYGADFGEIGHRSRSKPATFSVKPATSG